jgi:2-amino-4-hydroxy-6-hydroxymethyldihydropteridine diphosphokinase
LTTVVLALGANLGDRVENLRQALRLLDARGVRILRVSSAWETPPMPADQPWYVNAVAVGTTALDPEGLLTLAKAVEHEMGRQPTRRWGPRPIDVDILLFDGIAVSTPALTIPHAGLAERAFVLAPLAEVWPGVVPVLNERVSALLAAVDQSGLRRLGPLTWHTAAEGRD